MNHPSLQAGFIQEEAGHIITHHSKGTGLITDTAAQTLINIPLDSSLFGVGYGSRGTIGHT
jgi:hypothetical protein